MFLHVCALMSVWGMYADVGCVGCNTNTHHMLLHSSLTPCLLMLLLLLLTHDIDNTLSVYMLYAWLALTLTLTLALAWLLWSLLGSLWVAGSSGGNMPMNPGRYCLHHLIFHTLTFIPSYRASNFFSSCCLKHKCRTTYYYYTYYLCFQCPTAYQS